MRRSTKVLAAAGAAGVLVAGWLGVPALGASGAGTVYGCVNSSQHTLTHVSTTKQLSCPSQQPVNWPAQIGPAPSPSPTATPTSSPSPSPSPTQTGGACTAMIGQNCGPYDDTNIPMANGYDTYVGNQAVNVQSGTTQTITANSPGDWSMQATDKPLGFTGVQTFPDVQQLTNDWCGSVTNFASCSNPTDMPLGSLNSLTVTYNETSPHGTNDIYEFAPDVWNDNYGSDVMFWADTSPTRCTDNGLDASQIIGQATLSGQQWTVYRYGGQAGDEIMFILDGGSDQDPVDNGTCAQQSSGTIDILAGFKWLVNNGFMSGLGKLSQLNTGWEVTSADNATFSMNSYSIGAS